MDEVQSKLERKLAQASKRATEAVRKLSEERHQKKELLKQAEEEKRQKAELLKQAIANLSQENFNSMDIACILAISVEEVEVYLGKQ